MTPPPKKRANPEVALQIAIVAYCRPLLLPGVRLMGCNGEFPEGGEEAKKRAAKRKAMGYTKGMPDLEARGRDLLWIECKIPPNKQTPEQRDFEAWALSIGDGYAVVTSTEEALLALREWGLAS